MYVWVTCKATNTARNNLNNKKFNIPKGFPGHVFRFKIQNSVEARYGERLALKQGLFVSVKKNSSYKFSEEKLMFYILNFVLKVL